jgi:hypothetical protein
VLLNTIVCDFCPASVPNDASLQGGFTRLTLQGEGGTKFQPLLGPNAPNHLDVCPQCFGEFLSWAQTHRAKGQSTEPQTEPDVDSSPEHVTE